METFHPPEETEEILEDKKLQPKEIISEKWLREKIDNLIPLIQEKWPNIASQSIEAAIGNIDELVKIISENTGKSTIGIKNQLLEIIDSIQSNNWEIGSHIEPIESQLEELLDELNKTLRPKIENPIRQRPILSIAIATGIGLVIGSLLTNTRKYNG
tara:strand:- start:2273 stop:2743 length:471 start_codon:yes stop_codon:yes gene_type:complete